MTERSAEILAATIKEFIRSGEPVSSGDLYARYDFGIRPAMIRLELLDLTDRGYLEQPYHSAGRVPSDMGYKFFAEQAINGTGGSLKHSPWEAMLEHGDWEGLLENFSRELGVVGILAERTFQHIHKDGLEYLFDRLDIESRSELAEVVRDVEEIRERIFKNHSIFESNDFLEVFVGKNQFLKSDCLSLFAADYDVGGEKVYFFAVGPKRMDYEKTVEAMKELKPKKIKPKGQSKKKSK